MREVRVRVHAPCYFTAIELLDKGGKVLSKAQIWDKGEWSSYPLEEGEVVMGFFGQAIDGMMLKSVGLVVQRLLP